VDDGELSTDFPTGHVDFGRVIVFKDQLLARAWENFNRGTAPSLRPAFEEFRVTRSAWLGDYALFMAIREAHSKVAWIEWPEPLVMRESAAIARARRDRADAIGRHQFAQFLVSRQLAALQAHARERDVKLIGDLPIFVAPDSADVWANPHLFKLDA